MAGSLSAAWICLPVLGQTHTSLLDGLLVILAGGILLGNQRLSVAVLALLALGVAVWGDSGGGDRRIIGTPTAMGASYRILSYREDPDSTVAVAEDKDTGSRTLFIDGFAAAADLHKAVHYMAWMGRLPMIMHPDPHTALVICFGTGQTCNGVREEGADHIDMVDVSPAVFANAPLFPSNHNVLEDPRVTHIVMDGRAWLRRTQTRYDVITLEPMAPTFAGVNALYSEDFYRLAKARLKPGGIVAQWVPFHLLIPFNSVSITKTFQSVFPNACLWIDPVDWTGILVGSVEPDGPPMGDFYPGLSRDRPGRNLTPAQISGAVKINGPTLADYAKIGKVITDDNQLLAYGTAFADDRYKDLYLVNVELLTWAWRFQFARALESKAQGHPQFLAQVQALLQAYEQGQLSPQAQQDRVVEEGKQIPEVAPTMDKFKSGPFQTVH